MKISLSGMYMNLFLFRQRFPAAAIMFVPKQSRRKSGDMRTNTKRHTMWKEIA